MKQVEDELYEIRSRLDDLIRDQKTHGLEVRWAAWFSLIALCVIAWRVW